MGKPCVSTIMGMKGTLGESTAEVQEFSEEEVLEEVLEEYPGTSKEL